jgi:hypothetical protein
VVAVPAVTVAVSKLFVMCMISLKNYVSEENEAGWISVNART